MKMLFLDQNTQMRSIVRSALRSKYNVDDLEIDVPVDVADAVNKVKASVNKDVYDLIITEYYPNGSLNGYDFLERMRVQKLTSWRTAFIILTSQEPATKDLEKVLGAGELNIDGYIYKPFTPDKLLGKIIELLDIKKKLTPIYNLMHNEEYLKAIQCCIAQKNKIFTQNSQSNQKKYLADVIHLELVSYLKMKDYQGIVKLFREALTYKGSSITKKGWFLYFYAKSLYQLGEYSEAEKISESIKKVYPQYVKNYELLADIFHAQKKDEESLALLKVARDISPLNIERHVALGKQALLSGDLETAVEANKFVINKGTKSCLYTIDTHANLAHVYAELGQFDEALATLDQGSKTLKDVDPVGVEFSTEVMKSQIYAKKGDEAQAKSSFETALHIYDQQIAPTQGENASFISDDIKLFFSAECLENGHQEIAQSLISEVVEAGTHRQDLLEKHLKKTLRTQDIAQNVGKIIDVTRDIPELVTMEDEFLDMTQTTSIYDKIAGDDVDELTQNFKSAMDKINEGDLHQAAQFLESIVDGPLDHDKTMYQNAMESVRSGDWKKAISILKLENIRNQDNPRTYFDLAQLSFFYLEKNLDTVASDEYTYEKMFFQAQDYFDIGMKKLTSENEGQYKTLIKLIQYVMIKIEKKRSELKAK